MILDCKCNLCKFKPKLAIKVSSCILSDRVQFCKADNYMRHSTAGPSVHIYPRPDGTGSPVPGPSTRHRAEPTIDQIPCLVITDHASLHDNGET